MSMFARSLQALTIEKKKFVDMAELKKPKCIQTCITF